VYLICKLFINLIKKVNCSLKMKNRSEESKVWSVFALFFTFSALLASYPSVSATFPEYNVRLGVPFTSQVWD